MYTHTPHTTASQHCQQNTTRMFCSDVIFPALPQRRIRLINDKPHPESASTVDFVIERNRRETSVLLSSSQPPHSHTKPDNEVRLDPPAADPPHHYSMTKSRATRPRNLHENRASHTTKPAKQTHHSLASILHTHTMHIQRAQIYLTFV